MNDKLIFNSIAKVDETYVDECLEGLSETERANEIALNRRSSLLKTVFAAAISLAVIALAAPLLFVILRPVRSVPAPNSPSVSYENRIYVTDVDDDSSLIGVNVDYAGLHSSSPDENAPMGDRSFTFGSLIFDGTPVEGLSGYVLRRAYNTYDEYEYMDKNTGAVFEVDKNGSLGFYMNADDESWENIVSDDIGDEEAANIAKEFAGSFRNISDYEVSKISVNAPRIKTVFFQKTVNGFTTADRFQVDISYDGTVLGYTSYMTERIPANVKTDDIDIDAIDKAVADHLEKITGEGAVSKIEKTKTLLSLLSDGKRIIIEQYDLSVVQNDVLPGHVECIEVMIVLDE
ncbi:MAG: hypothetical protein K6G89_03630 [Clostridia bacterium]|nr:hypothetical protein [Clostridia bacterium]